MGSESVGSSNPVLEFNKSQKQQFSGPQNTPEVHQPILHNMELDTCFHCKKQGHWAVNCPDKQKKKAESPTDPTPAMIGDQSILDRPCPCGGGSCIVRTSKTPTNPGRKFYKCPLKMGMQCNFFQWCDMASSDQWRDVPLTPYPMCPCGAGLCHRLTSKKYNGRPFFVCPVKQGEGSCGFIRWEDALTKTLSNGHLDESKHSPRLAFDGQEKTKRTHEDHKTGDGNKLKVIASPVSMEGRSDPPLMRECHVKEETVRLDSMVLDDAISPVGNLILNKDKKTVPVAIAGQCFSESSHPRCSCGAGLCTRLTEKEGENKGRTYFVCPVEKGEGACNFFQWDVKKEANRIDEENKHGDGDKRKGIVSPVSRGEGSDSRLTREYHVEEEMVRLDSDSVVFSNLVSPIRNLTLSEEKRSVPVGKAGQCLWCGKEGHWSKECITSNPPCFRCGKSGHWMNDCTA
ncbi:zinc finger protein [Macleaya cordata]|uniref:Zinc finger protein n=1 Tax=Macleaya cordata TaxID=56857 RepID=A0A200QH18_MACCD|nr:zinc finger protein [Macleaya cordata]